MTTMQAANKYVVKRFNQEVIQEGRESSLHELMDDDFINRSAPPGTDNGALGMWNTFNNVLRPAMPDIKVEILDQVAEGDRVTTRKRITGTHLGTLMGIEATHASISIDVIDIVRIRAGKYLEHWGVNTLPSVLASLRSR
ncbi:ester cyclase [Rhodanobacter sp. BL-MT-08]